MGSKPIRPHRMRQTAHEELKAKLEPKRMEGLLMISSFGPSSESFSITLRHTPPFLADIRVACVHAWITPRRFTPLSQQHRVRIDPQALLRRSYVLLQSLQHSISRRVLPIPPTPTVFDECVIEVGAIQQEHISQVAPLLLLAAGLEDDIFSED